jgi:Protein tyrosine and serine/threonine kinase
MTGETTLPRPFGDFLLVAQLGDDPLGSVYRAIHAADEKRFLRLRILQSGELSPRAVFSAGRRLEERGAALAHDGIVRRPQFGTVGDVPFMAWYETAGWTLDRVLFRARAARAPVTTEYALLLGEKLVEATAAATRFLEADLVPHSVLWPGFVSISNDAEVRIGGFGLAPAILPVLKTPRMLREVAPYVSPEARERRRAVASSDVYSLGIMLLELLTGRRPALGAPLPEIRTTDPFSAEIGAFLRRALAPPEERYASIEEMRLALQETRMAAPRLLYPAGLAFYLYRLLNPEIHGVTPSDPDSTNPVETEPRLAGEPELSADDPESWDGFVPAAPTEEREPLAALPDEEAPSALSAPEPELEAGSPPDAPDSFNEAAAALFAEGEEPLAPAAEPVAAEPEPVADVPRAALPRLPIRARGTGALLLLAATVFGLAVLIDNERAARAARPPHASMRLDAPPRRPPAVAHVVPAAAPVLESAPAAAPVSAPAAMSPQVAVADASRRLIVAPGAALAKRSRAVRAESASARRTAEDWRFQAAFARVAAERNDGQTMASESFQEATSRQSEAESLYRQGRYEAAREAFEVAANLFREAETISHEERVRRVQLSSSSSR